jgi:hypothetical protein
MSKTKSILTREFWADARERLLWTFAQTFIATIPLNVVASAASGDVDQVKAIGIQAATAALAASFSLLKSLVFASKPNTVSPASSAPVPPLFDLDFSDEDFSDEEITESIMNPKVDESLLPDESMPESE